MNSRQLQGFYLGNWKNRAALTETGKTAGAKDWEKRSGVWFWICYFLMNNEQLGI